MADLKENAIGLLSSTALVDMQTLTTKRTLYTVPVGKVAIITHVVVRNPTLTLAACNDVDMGDDATCTTWRQTNNEIATLTAATNSIVLEENNVMQVVVAAGQEFGIYINTGAVGAATATIDVFGYLYDA